MLQDQLSFKLYGQLIAGPNVVPMVLAQLMVGCKGLVACLANFKTNCATYKCGLAFDTFRYIATTVSENPSTKFILKNVSSSKWLNL